MIYEECFKYGFDLSNDRIPIVPAAHYICGGIKVDHFGESSIPGLFSFGESSCTGVHGANRLASNSLLESAVFSSLAIDVVGKYLQRSIPVKHLSLISHVEVGPDHETVPEFRRALQQIMWKYVSIMRNETGLSHALKEIAQLLTQTRATFSNTVNSAQAELSNMLTLAPIIIRAALIRKESRGTHYMVDYPHRDDSHWLGRLVFEKDQIKMEPLSHAPS